MSVMLNIKVLEAVWHVSFGTCRSCHIQSQELLLLALPFVLLAMGTVNDLPALSSCRCDNIGLVSLILLDWELRVLYHCTICIRHPDLVSLEFYAIPYIPHYTF